MRKRRRNCPRAQAKFFGRFPGGDFARIRITACARNASAWRKETQLEMSLLSHCFRSRSLHSFTGVFGPTLLLSLTALTPATATSLITNGNFANVTPSLTTNEICSSNTAVFGYSPCTAAGWTGTYQIGNGATVGIYGVSFGIPQPDPGGTTNALILQTNSNASQSVVIPATGMYSLTFYTANRSNVNNGPQTFEALLDGTVLATYTDLPGTWTPEAVSFDASAGTHTVEFLGIDPSKTDQTAFIDDVNLGSPTPEPATLALFGLSLAGFAARARVLRKAST